MERGIAMKWGTLKRMITMCIMVMLLLNGTQFITTAFAVSADDYTCYWQTDDRWANHSFGQCTTSNGSAHPAYIGKTVTYNGETFYYGSGCSLLALTNTIAALTGKFVNPATLADFAVSNGYRTPGSINAKGLYSNWCKVNGAAYGISYVSYYNNAFSTDVQNHIKSGGAAILNVPGHFVCCATYNPATDEYLILDSAPTSSRGTAGTGKRWVKASVLNTSGNRLYVVYGAYLFSSPDPDPNKVTFKTPLTCYTVSEGDVTTYTRPSGNQVSGYITGSTDECKISQVYENGRVEVTYPTKNGSKTAYANLSDFISASQQVTNYSYNVSVNTTVYRRSDMDQSIGTVYSTDSITVVAESNGKLQIIYPISGGYKLGWIDGGTVPELKVDTRYPKNIKTYTNASGNVTTYSAINGGSTGSIFTSDLCTIIEVYTNGWCKVDYPTSGGTKTAYAKLADFVDSSCAVTPTSFTPSKTLTVYTRRNLSTALGSVWTTDKCTLVASSGDLKQIIYPLDGGGYKMGWVNTYTPVSIWPVPMKAYINSATERAAVYEGVNNNANYGQIFVDDLCTINAVESNGWIYVNYPISNGTKNGYVPQSVFVPNPVTAYTATASKQITTYQKSVMTDTFGYISAGDTITVVGKVNNTLQVIYPLDAGGYKLAWIYASELTTSLSSISIATKPTKTTYTEGESLNTSGLVVKATYSDNSQKTVTGYTVSGYSSTPGEKTITVTYTEGGVTRTAYFSVTVNSKSPSKLAITKQSSKRAYLEGKANFDFSDMEVTVTYNNGTSAKVTGYELFGLDTSVGTHVVTVKYTENGMTVSTSFTVTVSAKQLISIYLNYTEEDGQVTKIPYGGTFDTSAIQVIAVYDNDDYEVVDDYTVEGLNNTQPGDQTITIRYSGKSVEMTVRVLRPVVQYQLVLPRSLKTIEDGAFKGTDVMSVVVPDGCKQIGSEAFANCSGLLEIYLPASVTDISYDAFDGCDQLIIYAPAGSKAIQFAKMFGIDFEVSE